MYSSADTLLQKASLQLRGQWQSAKQDDLQDYLSSLNRKTNLNSVKFKDMSDISMSSDDVEIEFAKSSDDDVDVDTDWRKNKFFKQPTHFDMPQPKTVPNSPFIMSSAFPQKGPTSSVLRPGSYGGISVPLTGGRSLSQTSSALNRASALVQKIEKRVSGAEPRPKSGMRISFNIDSDEDLKGNLKDSDHSNDSNSEKNFRKSGRRFLKKPQPEETVKTKDIVQNASEKSKPEKIPDSVLERRNSLMLSTSIVLSSDDESMAEFIGKLSLPDNPPIQKDHISQQGGRLSRNSSMERKPSILKRSPSPRQIHSPSPSLKNQNSRSPSPAFAARTLRHLQSVTEDLTLAESLPAEIVEEEPVEENDEADPSKSTEKDFKLNVFNIEDLGSSFQGSQKKNMMEKTKQEKEKLSRKKSHHSKPSRHSSRKSSQHSSRPSSRHSSRHSSKPSSKNSSIMEEILSKEQKIFSSFGLQTVDDLLPQTQLLPSQHRSVSFDTGSLKVTSSHHEESVTEVMSEIHTQRSVTPLSRMHSSHSSVTGAYSEDFVSTNISESDRNVYTEDFHTVSDMGTATLSHDTFLSATNTETSSYESSKQKQKNISRKSKRRRSTPKVIRVCNEGTQTNELDFIHAQLEASPWNSLYANQDWKGRPLMTGTTKPVTSATPHMCGQACLNAHLPSQSNLVAVHEIMKQQLEFTRNFCESQKYLYHSLVEALRPDYVYTTLEATKEYIKKHRKPKLTMKKALEMVELEMQS